MNLNKLIKLGTKSLNNAGISNSKNEAKMLLCYVEGITNSELFLAGNKEASTDKEEEFFRLIDERSKRKPIQHILETQDFMGLKFKVNEHVLIPRRETEELVEIAVDLIKKNGKIKTVLDLCTGSGAIGISVAKLTNAVVCLADLSKEALVVTKYNSKLNSVDSKITVIESDLFKSINRSFDMIISNPPYIESAEISKLEKEVKDHEPLMALDGGEDGLSFYKKIVNEAYDHLNEKGFVLLEIGYNQGEELMNMLIKDGRYIKIRIIKDLSGNNRMVVAEKREG